MELLLQQEYGLFLIFNNTLKTIKHNKKTAALFGILFLINTVPALVLYFTKAFSNVWISQVTNFSAFIATNIIMLTIIEIILNEYEIGHQVKLFPKKIITLILLALIDILPTTIMQVTGAPSIIKTIVGIPFQILIFFLIFAWFLWNTNSISIKESFNSVYSLISNNLKKIIVFFLTYGVIILLATFSTMRVFAIFRSVPLMTISTSLFVGLINAFFSIAIVNLIIKLFYYPDTLSVEIEK